MALREAFSRYVPNSESVNVPALNVSSFYRKMLPWVFALLIFGASVLEQTELVRIRYNSALSLLVFAVVFWCVRKRFADFPYKTLACVLFLATVLLTTLLYRPATIPVLSWCFFLLLPARPAGILHGDYRPARQSARKFILGLMVVTFGLITFIRVLLRYKPLIVDEILYLLQSTLFTVPGYGRGIDETLKPFFVLRLSYVFDGQLHGQYPPGYPLILHLFSMANLRFWTDCVLAAMAVGATYLMGKRLASASVGAVAALLVASNPEFLFIGGMYFPHTLDILLAALAGLLLLCGEEKTRVVKHVAWLAAGFLAGSMVAVRPLTGAAVGASLALWLLVRGRLEKKEFKKFLLSFIAGSILPIAFLLHYNLATNGDPFIFGYQAANGELVNLGFGRRGVISYDEQGYPFEKAADFTPGRALKQNLEAIHDAAILLFAAFSIFPLLLVSISYGFKPSWKVILVFLLLPAAHALVPYGNVRYSLELLPFLCVGLGGMLVFLESRNRYLARSVLVFMLTCNLGLTVKKVYDEYIFREQYFSYFRQVDDFKQKHGKVLVLVKSEEDLLEALYWFNVDKFPGDVIVARDIGEKNSVLREKFPAHKPLYIPG